MFIFYSYLFWWRWSGGEELLHSSVLQLLALTKTQQSLHRGVRGRLSWAKEKRHKQKQKQEQDMDPEHYQEYHRKQNALI